MRKLRVSEGGGCLLASKGSKECQSAYFKVLSAPSCPFCTFCPFCPFCSWAQTDYRLLAQTGAETNQGASTQGVRAGWVGCAAGAQNGRSPTPFRPVFIPHKPHISPPRRQKNKKIATIPCKIKKSDYLCTRFWKAMLSEGGHKRLVP